MQRKIDEACCGLLPKIDLPWSVLSWMRFPPSPSPQKDLFFLIIHTAQYLQQYRCNITAMLQHCCCNFCAIGILHVDLKFIAALSPVCFAYRKAYSWDAIILIYRYTDGSGTQVVQRRSDAIRHTATSSLSRKGQASSGILSCTLREDV